MFGTLKRFKSKTKICLKIIRSCLKMDFRKFPKSPFKWYCQQQIRFTDFLADILHWICDRFELSCSCMEKEYFCELCKNILSEENSFVVLNGRDAVPTADLLDWYLLVVDNHYKDPLNRGFDRFGPLN